MSVRANCQWWLMKFDLYAGLGITEHNSKFTDRGKKRPAEDELEKPVSA